MTLKNALTAFFHIRFSSLFTIHRTNDVVQSKLLTASLRQTQDSAWCKLRPH